MFLKMLGVEHKKHFRRWTLRIMIILMCVLLTAGYIISAIGYARSAGGPDPRWIEQEKATITWPGFIGSSLSLSRSFGFVLAIILVGGLTAQEYSSRTASLQIGHGTPRLLFLPAKFLGFFLPIFVLVISPVLFGAAISAIGTVAVSGGIDVSTVDFRRFAATVIGITYSLLPCASFTFLLAVLTRSTAASIGIGMGYFLVAENILYVILWSSQGTYADIANHLPGKLADHLINLIEGVKNPLIGSSPPDLAATIIAIAAYTLCFFLLALAVFYRQDLSAG
jgi:ABC-2 type transport system permease protein